jgi:hypothetical protein
MAINMNRLEGGRRPSGIDACGQMGSSVSQMPGAGSLFESKLASNGLPRCVIFDFRHVARRTFELALADCKIEAQKKAEPSKGAFHPDIKWYYCLIATIDAIRHRTWIASGFNERPDGQGTHSASRHA